MDYSVLYTGIFGYEQAATHTRSRLDRAGEGQAGEGILEMTQFEIECRTGGQSMVILGSLVLGVQNILRVVLLVFYAPFMTKYIFFKVS